MILLNSLSFYCKIPDYASGLFSGIPCIFDIIKYHFYQFYYPIFCLSKILVSFEYQKGGDSLIQYPAVFMAYHVNTYRRFTISYSSAIRSAPLASVIMHLPSLEPYECYLHRRFLKSKEKKIIKNSDKSTHVLLIFG